eukprot:1161162-Pelagomonas_calceolata.AAC.5
MDPQRLLTTDYKCRGVMEIGTVKTKNNWYALSKREEGALSRRLCKPPSYTKTCTFAPREPSNCYH